MARAHPAAVVARSAWLLASGQVRFVAASRGRGLHGAEGQFEVFRHARRDGDGDLAGVFCVWFTPRGGTASTIALSVPMMLGFIGFPGWREKHWLVERETGRFAGLYGFRTRDHARAYESSYAMRLSRARSRPGRFRTETFEADACPYAVAGPSTSS